MTYDPIFRNNPLMDITCRMYSEMVFNDTYEQYIPPHILRGLIRYRDEHIPVGSFLEAVLSNNLTGALASADEYSLYSLPFIHRWIRENMHKIAWGSRILYDQWIQLPAKPLTLHTS